MWLGLLKCRAAVDPHPLRYSFASFASPSRPSRMEVWRFERLPARAREASGDNRPMIHGFFASA
jgi:hypothetical protein